MGKVTIKMQKAMLLAENIHAFIKFVDSRLKKQYSDKVYQIKLLVKEFRFQILVDEIVRINQYDWNEKYTLYLVESFRKGLEVIDEYVKNHYDELFMFSGRMYTLKNLSQAVYE